jgi:Sin3 binding region of histone deacetylase complex subunit SAP30
MSEEIRPVVDFSKLSRGSLKRYEALYGISCNREDLAETVKDHFTLTCYNVLKSPKSDVKAYEPKTSHTCGVNAFYTDCKTPEEIIDNFLKIKTDDKEEPGTRKSTRFRDKSEKPNN